MDINLSSLLIDIFVANLQWDRDIFVANLQWDHTVSVLVSCPLQ